MSFRRITTARTAGTTRWLDAENFYSIVQFRTSELDVLRAQYPSQADLISVEDVCGSLAEHQHITTSLRQAGAHGSPDRIYQFVWALNRYKGWSRSTRLTLPLLLLDEILIHQKYLEPSEQGALNIHAGVYPTPTLFDRLLGPSDIAAWVSKNFNTRPGLPHEDRTIKTARPHERRQVTLEVGNPATLALYRDIYEFASETLGSEEIADIVASDALKWYFRKERGTQILADARTKVFGYAKRLVAAQLAAKAIDVPIYVESLVDQFTGPSGDSNIDADKIDRRLRVVASLKQLTTEESGVLVLRYCYDLSYDKLAYLMDCDVPAVRKLAARAMSTFAANLDSDSA